MAGADGQPGGRPLPGRHLIVGRQVYDWLIREVPARRPFPSVQIGFSAPWNDPGWVTGIPVHISDDPDWGPDHWALVEDGVVVNSGYGEPMQPQLPAVCNHVWREDEQHVWECQQCGERE